VTVPVRVDHELDMALDASKLISRHVLECLTNFIICGCDYVNYKLVHRFLRAVKDLVPLDLLDYRDETLHIGWNLFFFKLCLSLPEDFVLLSANSFLFLDLLLSEFLLAATGLIFSALYAPPSSSNVFVNIK
jgi:hypothetical protein